jgi:hypothetical protein
MNNKKLDEAKVGWCFPVIRLINICIRLQADIVVCKRLQTDIPFLLILPR